MSEGWGVCVFHPDSFLNPVPQSIAAAGYDGKLCLMGNMDPSQLCAQGNPGNAGRPPDRLRRTVSKVMTSAAGDGGFIFGTWGGQGADISPERIDWMYGLAREPRMTTGKSSLL